MQKSLYNLVMLGLILLSAMSCKKETLDTYHTSNSIYFENFDIYDLYTDTANVTFAYGSDLSKDTIIKIKVKVTGGVPGSNKTFKIVADSSSTAIEGKHYQKLPDTYTFASNQVEDTIQVKLLRGTDLKNKEVTLVLKLVPTESFTTNLLLQGSNDFRSNMSYVKYKIAISDILVEPRGWLYEFGKFTKKKMDIVCMLGNISPLWFIDGDNNDYGSFAYYVKDYYLVSLLSNYLTTQKNNGSPVLYEDGTPMVMNDY